MNDSQEFWTVLGSSLIILLILSLLVLLISMRNQNRKALSKLKLGLSSQLSDQMLSLTSQFQSLREILSQETTEQRLMLSTMSQNLLNFQNLQTTHSGNSSAQLELIDKMVGLLASKGPLEYQAIQVMDSNDVAVESYDPSDAAEIQRMREAGRFDVYGDADTSAVQDWPTDVTAEPYVIR